MTQRVVTPQVRRLLLLQHGIWSASGRSTYPLLFLDSTPLHVLRGARDIPGSIAAAYYSHLFWPYPTSFRPQQGNVV